MIGGHLSLLHERLTLSGVQTLRLREETLLKTLFIHLNTHITSNSIQPLYDIITSVANHLQVREHAQ